MQDGTLRVAIVGFGLGGRVFHAPLVAATPGLSVTTIVTADPARREQAKERYPAARLVDRADELWRAPADHDLVVLTTPNRFHVPLATMALEAGLPVVIDKPMAPTAAEGAQLVELAQRKGMLLSVFQNRRWDDDFLTARRLVDAGTLGRVVRFESRFERWRPERAAGAWREQAGADEAGGLLFDLGSHLIDQAIVLFGRPTQVYAEVERRRPGAEVDDDTFVALTHPGGVQSQLWCSVVARLLGPRLRVLGLGGAFEVHGLDGQEDALATGGSPPARTGILATGQDAEQEVPLDAGAYSAYYAGIAQALRDGGDPPVDPADAVAGLHVIEAAAESARTGSVVTPVWDGA